MATRLSTLERSAIVTQAAMCLHERYFMDRGQGYHFPWQSKVAAEVPQIGVRVLGDQRYYAMSDAALDRLKAAVELAARDLVFAWITDKGYFRLLCKLLTRQGGRFVVVSRECPDSGFWAARPHDRFNYSVWCAPSLRGDRTDDLDRAIELCTSEANATVHGSGSLDDSMVWDGLMQRPVYILRRTDAIYGSAVVVQDNRHETAYAREYLNSTTDMADFDATWSMI